MIFFVSDKNETDASGRSQLAAAAVLGVVTLFADSISQLAARSVCVSVFLGCCEVSPRWLLAVGSPTLAVFVHLTCADIDSRAGVMKGRLNMQTGYGSFAIS